MTIRYIIRTIFDTYLADHSAFIPDWWQKLSTFCFCSGVNDATPCGGKGTDGPSSGTGLDDGVGACDLKAFCNKIKTCKHIICAIWILKTSIYQTYLLSDNNGG